MIMNTINFNIIISTPSRRKNEIRKWSLYGSKKIVLEVNSLEEMEELRYTALEKGIFSARIRDAGHTEVDPGTVTVLGLGPARAEELDVVTGKLKLIRDPKDAVQKELEKKKKETEKIEKKKTELEAAVAKSKAEKTGLLQNYFSGLKVHGIL